MRSELRSWRRVDVEDIGNAGYRGAGLSLDRWSSSSTRKTRRGGGGRLGGGCGSRLVTRVAVLTEGARRVC